MLKEPVSYPYFRGSSWSEAWTNGGFRKKIIVAAVLFICIMLLLPHFFAVIEAREGAVINDWLLQQIPAQDCSVTIFIFLWGTSLLAIWRCIQQPEIFLRMMYLLIVLTLIRVLCIWFIALDPPGDIIHLKDPLTSLTYGGRELFITKDLFFSGHTSNLFMICLCLQKKRDKQIALLATIVVATLVLVQHVHYTIDVVAAFIVTYCITMLSRRLRFFTI